MPVRMLETNMYVILLEMLGQKQDGRISKLDGASGYLNMVLNVLI